MKPFRIILVSNILDMMTRIINRMKFLYRKIRRLVRILRQESLPRNYDICAKDDNTILFVAHSAQQGGAPMLGCNIIENLRRKGYSFVIILMEPGPLYEEYNELGYVFMPLSRYDLKRFLNRLKKNKTIRHCLANSSLTGEYAEVISQCGLDIVTLVHEMDKTILSCCVLNYLEDAMEYSKKIVFPSSVVLNSCIKLLKKDYLNKVDIRPQGIYRWPMVEFVNKSRAKQVLAERLGIDSSRNTILNIGSTISRKGFDLFVEACRLDTTNIYIWVGVTDNKYYDEVMRKVGGIPDNFIPVPFLDNPADLRVFYEGADVLAMTSREDPFPSVVMEAFSLGTPVVAFDKCGGFVDIIKNNETGVLCEEPKTDNLIEGIRLILEDKTKYKFMSEQCFKCAREFSFEKYVWYLEQKLKE